MEEYFVTFYIKLSAKNEKDLSEKSEQIAEKLSKYLKKRIEPHGFVKLTKSYIQTTLGD